MELTTYNYYLRQVLGVETYIGIPQKATLVEPSASVAPEAIVDERTLVVVGQPLSDAEKSLLDKIMKAVGQQGNYVVYENSGFDWQSQNFRQYIVMQPQFFSDQKDFELFLLNDYKAVQVCSLEKMLPPQPAAEIQKNKQLLWSTLKKLFGS